MTDQKKQPYDEFNPQDYKTRQKQFWMLPKGVAAHTKLSPGAKMLYATLFSLGMSYGVAFTKKDTLQQYLGNPSTRTLLRWQNELVNAGLIRVLQKGRGMANSYYFLRHPLLGNAEENEFDDGPRYLHRNRVQGTQIVVTEQEARDLFKAEVNDWYHDALTGNIQPFPKPSWQYDRVGYANYREDWLKRIEEETLTTSEKQHNPDVNAEQTVVVSETNETVMHATNESTSSNHQPLDYDSIFDNYTNTQLVSNAPSNLSDKPSQSTDASEHTVYVPSLRDCYEAAINDAQRQNYTTLN